MCSNYTFWSGRSCYYPPYGEGKRCTGSNSGMCVYPDTTNGDVYRYCADKSDQVHTVNTLCPAFSLEEQPHCTAELKKYCSFSEYGHKNKYSKYSDYWSEYYYNCMYCFDPSNCTGSCAIPSPTPLTAKYSSDLHQHCRLPCEDKDGTYPDQSLCQDCLSCFDPSNCTGSCAIPSPTPVLANYSMDLHQHCRLVAL